MNKETQNLFNAPWKIAVCDSCITVRTQADFVCRCSKNEKGSKYAEQIRLIPELYDALKGAVKEACGTCAMMHVNPDTYDFVENGCPFSEENNTCDYRDCIAILRKVRGGE